MSTKDSYIEVSVVMVENNRKEFFVHQRTADKKIFPGQYAFVAGGKIELGELPFQAAKRELQEELGLETRIEPLFHVSYTDTSLKLKVYFFYTLCEGEEVVPSQEEFQNWGWKRPSEIEELMRSKPFCPTDKTFYEWYKKQYLS